ncbi:hypothetical protein Taro_003359 [Colocasia esculenta]|uniref:SHSP domain-containing protein n=1 Tax=Colocasia esculenta TaxID=4460 RepID=A0A843TJN1_COLES|nr:hypothetical protein [Colocasia esculenta]
MASTVSNLNTLSACFATSPQREVTATACARGKKNPFVSFATGSLWRVVTSGDGCRCTTRAMGGGADGKERSQEQQLQRAGKQPPRRSASQLAPFDLWDRFPTARTMQQMIETVERIMEDPFAYSGASFPSLDGDNSGVSYRRRRTPWEIKDGDGEYKMRFDMPGMTKKDVKVWVEDNILVVKAEKLPHKSKEGDGVEVEQQGEWSAKSYGRYNSRIVLPDNVMVEKIKAEVKDGVLYITIPKASTSTKVVNDIDVQ